MSTSTETTAHNDIYAGYAPDEDKPLASYGFLMSVFLTRASTFAAWFRRSGRELPDRIDDRDLVLLTLASHKASRLISKDKVTSAIRAPFARYEGPGGP